RPLAPDAVDRLIPRCRDEPADRVGRSAVTGPPLERRRDRVPERVLGEVEVAEDADQSGEDAPMLLAEEPRELFYAVTSTGISSPGRPSMEPKRADGIIPAAAIAPSSESASMR